MQFNIRHEEGFLTPQEVERVRMDVHFMRSDWRHISEYPIATDKNLRKMQDPKLIRSAQNQYFLGDSLYIITDTNQVDWDLQERITEKFGWLQDRVLKRVETVTNCPAEFMEGYAKPAFHIFHGEQDDMTPFQYHQDTTINRFDRQYDMDQIYSFLSLIESPEDFAGLEYKDTNDWSDLLYTEEKIFKYTTGQLFMWKGDKIHRMKRFAMKQGESRITLQGHYVIHKGKALVHW